ncbi:MAG: hypothetical protein M3N68_14385 [Actinomycetota bacterium]|nr:hypothetical protein [Actinomycetota bacterium]
MTVFLLVLVAVLLGGFAGTEMERSYPAVVLVAAAAGLVPLVTGLVLRAARTRGRAERSAPRPL